MSVKINKLETGGYGVDQDELAEKFSEVINKAATPPCLGTMTAVITSGMPRPVEAANMQEAKEILNPRIESSIDMVKEQMDKLERCITKCEYFQHCHAMSMVDAMRSK